jgi:hypothetical protein
VRQRAKDTGFATPTNFVDPGRPPEQTTRWGTFIDGTVTPEVWVHQWIDQWRDEDGNVLVYALRYRSAYDQSKPPPRDAPDNTRLLVSAARFSSTRVEQIKSETDKLMDATAKAMQDRK